MRHTLDYYKTPKFAVDILLDYISLQGMSILDCCSGNGEISNILKENELKVTTNDMDRNKPADHHFHAGISIQWPDEIYDFVITNPPYNEAFGIVDIAYRKARIGVAMLLRLSFLEPTFDRQDWLRENPLHRLIVLPRISFTGDGKTDSVTVAWMVWNKQDGNQRIFIVGKHNDNSTPKIQGRRT